MQINAQQDAPGFCDFNVMSQKLRQAVLNAHNEKRHVMVDIPIYKAGTACEGCPPGYKCDDSTKLCKDEKLYFPRYPPNPPKP
ncbi:hypothetical protein TELCIR_12090 [Teladorsagia circumcincta]|uniref:SCP domain-containing protein n=1 Tax=Teladorsagia circumcincta TaxID=45464 RepID=A0A2G9U7Q0_TELCI|nr:hypothetical protein TELCIR_12090 [Teladorsagia circumcincta]